MPRGAKGAKPAKAKVEAELPAARKSRGNEGSRVADLENRLAEARKREAEALEQQTATAGILRVISSSPADVQPVFAAVLTSAARLCDAFDAVILQVDGDRLRIVAHEGPIPTTPVGALPLHGTAAGRAVLDRRTIHVPDLQAEVDEYPESSVIARLYGGRTALNVPLVRGAEAIGAIAIRRTEVRPFTDRQIELLETFAEQVVIAIENVRLFNETKEALEQQTATSEILRVISSSPTDIQPTFDAIAASAVRLCEAEEGTVFRFDGSLIHMVAEHGGGPREIDAIQRVFPCRPSRGTLTGRVILTGRVVHQADIATDPEHEFHDLARFFRSVLAVPMLRDGAPIGAISVSRREGRAFSPKQIGLLETFAAQAVIAIENVRLFNETKEALAQQTATADILRVIASSPTDLQPVFDMIGQRAEKLCAADVSVVSTFDGKLVHLAALHGMASAGVETTRRVYPMRPDAETVMARTLRQGAVVHVPDVLGDPDYEQKDAAQAGGWRAALGVPMIRGGQVVGAIFVGRTKPGYFAHTQVELLKTFAAQAVIAIENVRLFNETKEALEQQTATSEVLGVISQSPTDVQPVFDTIVARAVRLCAGRSGGLYRLEAGVVHLVADASPQAEAYGPIRAAYPKAVDEVEPKTRRIYMEGAVSHLADVDTEPGLSDEFRERARVAGYRSIVGVPMVQEGRVIGGITVARAGPGLTPSPFSDREIGLLQVFAAQAVIAIENVRLFKELEARNRDLTEALAQQTATGEILRVIASSPTDLQPVMEAVAENAARVCGATASSIFRLEGEHLRLVAWHGSLRRSLAIGDTMPVSRDVLGGRAVCDRRTIHVEDVMAAEAEFPVTASRIRQTGSMVRTAVATPLLREGTPLGVIITIRGPEVHPFSAKQIALLETFANQAVIAIENVRLFNETKEALEQQTATSEILRVIASSPTDLQPVMEAVAENAARVCGATDSSIFRLEGEHLRLVARHGSLPRPLAIGDTLPVIRGYVAGRAVCDRRTIHVADIRAAESEFPQAVSSNRQAGSFNRTMLATPLLREGTPLGVIVITRGPEVHTFSATQITLLETFANQAVIAIENVRLFTELRERTGELTRSVEQLTALGEISQAVSSTLDLETVLDTITERARQLAGADGGAIYEYDEGTQQFNLRATRNVDATVLQALRAVPLRKGEGLMGRATEIREPSQIADIAAPGVYQSHLRDVLIEAGYRALLSVPLLREDQIIGSLSLNRKAPGQFPPEVVDVLRTFATQSALAIQNARLFREIEEKGRQLEAASRHKSEFLANMSHELRTPLNAILGFNEMILGQIYGEVPADLREPLTDIQHSGKHLLRLINNVLDLSKIEAGRMELALTDYAVQDIVERVRASLQPLAAEKELAFVATVSADIPLAYGDGGRITQCLMNLAGNALKFTHRGRVELGIEFQGDVLVYRVADTGIGIAPDKIESVFAEFRQGDATITSEFGGTGLGLSITKKFVEMHGGRIWVESEVGRGSTFFFAVPLRLTGGTPA